MTDKTKLLPCPFPHDEIETDLLTIEEDERFYFVRCDVCGCEGPQAATSDAARFKWNTRPALPDEAGLVEILAALEHEQWAHWTDYMLKNMDDDNVLRWNDQIDTKYADLSEQEKNSDRSWALKVITALRPYLSNGEDKARIAELDAGLINLMDAYIKCNGDDNPFYRAAEKALKSEATPNA